jgi:large subunit ribosomal protein L25
LHELSIECPVVDIPDRILVSINALELGDSITVDELELPGGAKVLAEGQTVVVQCVAAMEAPEEEEAAPASVEPEVIGRRDTGEEEGEGEG